MVRRSHNPRLYRILAIGRDISQLSSGANVLTQAGYSADIFLTVELAVRRVLVSKYHLAVVSSTFTCDEQIAIRSRLKQVRRNLPVLLLGPEHDCPEIFLATIGDCLKQKKKFQPGTTLDRFPLDHDTKRHA